MTIAIRQRTLTFAALVGALAVAACDGVTEPGGTVDIRVEQGALKLNWWHAVTGPDGPQPGPLRRRTQSLH